MRVNPADILPTQDFLKAGTVKYIFDCIADNNEAGLPSSPIVRKDSEGNMLAVDGHNLIAVRLALGEDIEVHLATSKIDGLAVKNQKDIDRNADLLEKYNQISELRAQTVLAGINAFQDLIDQNQEMFND